MFVEKFFCLKPAEFYLKGINKWQKVFQNNGENTIDLN